MLGSVTITTLIALSALVRADPSPNTPSPGAVYNAGAQCPIAWGVDSTGLWKTMNIQLMTGSNLAMVPLTTVTTVDATNPSTTTFSWTCPEVNPNSAIYFYQFTSPASNHTLWTGRFAIASDSGATTPPSQSTQPNGQAIPWGTGALANAADAKPPPTGANSSSAGASSASASSASGNVPVGTTSLSSTPTTASSIVVTSSLPVVATPSSSGSTSGTITSGGASTTGGPGGSASKSNAAMTTLSVDGRIFQAMIALGVTAAGFAAVL